MRIREANEHDAPALAKLCSQLGYNYHVDALEANLSVVLNTPEHKIFVAEEDQGVVCGYIHASEYQQLYWDKMINILALAVDEQFRSRGIGRLLIQKIEKWANERQAKWMRVTSATKRADAHRFYENNGYLDTKEQLRFLKELIQETPLN